MLKIVSSKTWTKTEACILRSMAQDKKSASKKIKGAHNGGHFKESSYNRGLPLCYRKEGPITQDIAFSISTDLNGFIVLRPYPALTLDITLVPDVINRTRTDITHITVTKGRW